MRRADKGIGVQGQKPAYKDRWKPGPQVQESIVRDQEYGDLRIARVLYEKWVEHAPSIEVVMTLRGLAGEDESDLWPGSKMLCQCLHGDLYRRVGSRDDCDYIRIFSASGVEPPDFAWMDDSCDFVSASSQRNRTTIRNQRRPSLDSGNVKGFRHHLAVERDVRDRVRKDAGYESQRPYGKQEAEPVFAETPGTRQLFSVAEASQLYSQAALRFGSENKAYVELAIRDLLKLGNRRGLAKAPSKEKIACLRHDFPNADEAIDEVERAAALAWMTPDGWFRMTPLLVWGPPGVGKTAFLQALAKSLQVPFRRFDIATLSMGSELFGLSLSWSTGRAGSLYGLLSESLVMNPVVMLDEIDKAAGNGNAPVIPPLLALLEPETSRTFRDEAIPVALDASQVVWCASGNDSHLLSGPLRSRFNEVRIEQPEGEAAIRVAGSIYRSLCNAAPWGKKFPKEIDRGLALSLANGTPREMSRQLAVAFGQAALSGRTYLKAEDFPKQPKSRNRMGFL